MNGRAARLLPYVLAFFSSLCIMVLELIAGRLVARHVGASLTVWTSVIGIMLGGICLGNVLGGRLADRIDPRRAIGPLYALGAGLTLLCLWMNAAVGVLKPALDVLPWDLRTVVVVTLDFLVPTTVLGMIGPVVATMAVERSPARWMRQLRGWEPAAGYLALAPLGLVAAVFLDILAWQVLGVTRRRGWAMAHPQYQWARGGLYGLGALLAIFLVVRALVALGRLRIPRELVDRSGSAIGLVYFMGAVGSIVGTFIAGFYLIYLAPTSTIVAVVAAALALLAAAFIGDLAGLGLGLGAAALLGLGAVLPLATRARMPGLVINATTINVVSLAGHALTFVLAARAARRLRADLRAAAEADGAGIAVEPLSGEKRGGVFGWLGRLTRVSSGEGRGGVDLTDLAVLSFVASLAFMALEMVAGRLVTRHLGSSVYGWTSVIGVLLGGLSLGNFLGGKAADRISRDAQASWLFLVASMLTCWVLLCETPMPWMVRNPIAHWAKGEPADPLFGGPGPALSQAISMSYAWVPGWDLSWSKVPMPWWGRVLFWTIVVFLLPALSMGTVSPVVAKLAIERVRQSKRTGQAIGQVYAWGMVGSIVGTFLAGFVLIDLLGTKGLLLVLATSLALAATALGSVFHAAWAGIPLGLCLIALVPGAWFEKQGLAWGIRDERGDPKTTKDEIAYADESNYYYIKVNNEHDFEGNKRTLVLDNLIHGYFVLGHPERLDYDYEHIYALVTRRVAEARAKREGLPEPARAGLNTLFLGGGSYTFPRYLRHAYPKTDCDVAEIDPSVTRTNRIALGLTPADEERIHTTWGDARQFVVNNQGKRKYDLVFGDAFNDFSVPWHLTTKQFNDYIASMLSPEGVYMINIIDVYESDAKAEERGRARAVREARQAAKRRVIQQSGGDEDKADKQAILAAMEAANPTPEELARAAAEAKAEARGLGGFIGSWTETARLTFPYVYVFGTDETPGSGLRETFVVVASKVPLEVDDLGDRDKDPIFFDGGKPFRPRPFPQPDMDALALRAHGIRLTDDYAPVENLLAPVAATRGDDD